VVLLLPECDAALLDKQFLCITLQYLLHQARAAQEDCFLKTSQVTCPVTLQHSPDDLHLQNQPTSELQNSRLSAQHSFEHHHIYSE